EPERKVLMTGTGGSLMLAQYASPVGRGEPGHLLVAREGVLLAQPVDPNTYALAGDSFPVQTGDLSVGAFSVSSTGGLAFRSTSQSTRFPLTWMDRTGKSPGTLGQPGPYREVAISRDGTRVA